MINFTIKETCEFNVTSPFVDKNHFLIFNKKQFSLAGSFEFSFCTFEASFLSVEIKGG